MTKLRNAARSKHQTVEIPRSKFVERVCEVLKQEGFIRSFRVAGEAPTHEVLRVYLKYANKTPAITDVVRVSKPGKRIYRGSSELPRVLQGLGVAVVSTSRGVMTERDAYRQQIGGEVLCYVW